MPRVYIIGATVGMPQLNLPMFEKVSEVLAKSGHEAIVPHHLFHDEENQRGGLTFNQSLQRRQAELEKCDYAVLLPGYSEDRYAAIEAVTAKNYAITRVPFRNLKKQLLCLK